MEEEENGEEGTDEGLVEGRGKTQRRGTEAKCGTGATKERNDKLKAATLICSYVG